MPVSGIASIYLGSTAISRVLQGNIQVFQSGGGGAEPTVLGLVIEGDSLMDGFATTNGPIAALYASYTGQTGTSRAASGDTLVNMDSTYASDVAPYYNALTANTVLLEGGTNDFHAGASAATVQAAAQSFAGKARATGFWVAVSTITKNTSWTTGADETARVAYNTWLRANWTTFADFLVDLEAISELSDTSNTAYFNADGLHLTDVSNGIVAEYIRTSLGVAAVSDTTPNAFTFTDATGATLSTVYTSNAVTISGINSPATITVTGGTYSINGGSYTSTAGTVSNGDTVTARGTASSANSTAVNVAVTVGGVTDTYTITTVSAGPSLITWDASNKGASATLANNDRDLTDPSGTQFTTALAISGKSTGKWYAEVSLPTLVHSGVADGSYVGIGLAKSPSAPLNSYLGSGGDGGMYFFQSNFYDSLISGGFTITNTVGGTSRTLNTNDIFQIAMDATAGKVWIGINNTWLVGSPSAGTTNWAAITAGTWYLAATMGEATSVMRLASTQTYTPPTGFSAWQ